MTEEFLHYIWEQGLFEKINIADTGEKVEIIHPGQHNTDSGPDFTDARIKINNILWAGNIEMHLDSASWNRHNHQSDTAYDSVILHVVHKNNKSCFRTNGEQIPTIELSFDDSYLKKFYELINGNQVIACKKDILKIDPLIRNIWLDSLCIDRLENKIQNIQELFEYTNNNWEETLYIGLARSFGFKTNSLPFEMLAKSLPLKLLYKYSSNLLQLEALLFGQAGFLKDQPVDEYQSNLKREYNFLQKTHNLKPIEKHLWKFLRLRPVNFPTIRISQFASLLNKTEGLFSKIIEIQVSKGFMELFSCESGVYWQSHYNFGKTSPQKMKPIGINSLSGILINTVIPFLFLYGKIRGSDKTRDRALTLLDELPAEKNATIKYWEQIGFKPENAMQSQALLQLYSNYCINKKCINCQIGNLIIRNTR